ncbi:hypothetical protein NB592_01830, partial [Vibrio parahaemolyticus]|uniref:hypothetical protein n=1 Tax=Vibrio parahaemolyticus TaxID=670 RepID=UPI00215C90B5
PQQNVGNVLHCISFIDGKAPLKTSGEKYFPNTPDVSQTGWVRFCSEPMKVKEHSRKEKKL